MKRYIGALLLLCQFFTAPAQSLTIGDQLPDGILQNYRGKALLLDFWATWCAPCRSMVPRMDSLQKTIGRDRLNILPVTYQSAATVAPVLHELQKLRPFDLPGLTGDTLLHRLFPHRSLPHYVWIDASGRVRGITEEKAVTAANLRRLLQNQGPEGETKTDTQTPYDYQKPLLVAGNGGSGVSFQYHSILTGFIPGLSGGMAITTYDSLRGQQFSVRNAPLIWLARLAFADNGRRFSNARVLLLSKDSARMTSPLSGQAYERWLADGNGYCYELALPPKLAPQAFTLIREDMRRLFPAYALSVEQRQLPCLALVRTGTTDHLQSKGGTLLVDITPYSAELRNAHLSQLMMRLERQYLQFSEIPVTDLTGYTGRVDLSLQAPLGDITALNKALAPYGLALEKRTAPVEVLVIRDAPAIPQTLNPKQP